MVSEIHRKNSMAYQEGKMPSVVRNELILLRAIVNFGASEGKLKKYDNQLNYLIPDPLPSRVHFYSIDELIALYKAAMRKRHTWHGKKTYRMSAHIAKFILVAVLTGTRASRICNASFIQELGRPWIDLDNGIFYRAAVGEFVALNKRADPIAIPARLLRMMRRWHKGSGKTPGCRYLIEYQGRPVDCRKGFYTLKNEVLPEDRAEVLNRHSMKHTAVTMLLQMGVPIKDVAVYMSTTEEIIREVYSSLIPGEFSPVHKALDEKKPRRARPGERPQLKVVGGMEASG
jgi:integrase